MIVLLNDLSNICVSGIFEDGANAVQVEQQGPAWVTNMVENHID
jgi:hypothetical protein